MHEDDRINVSVAVLEERLARWAETVQRDISALSDQLRRRDERFDNQIGELLIWKTLHTQEYASLLTRVSDIRLHLEEKIQSDIAYLKKSVAEKDVAFGAKVSLLKSQWTWLSAGIVMCSTLMGILIQLDVIKVGT